MPMLLDAREVNWGDWESIWAIKHRVPPTSWKSQNRRNKMYLKSLQRPEFYCNLRGVACRSSPRCFLDGKDDLVEPIDENRWALFL